MKLMTSRPCFVKFAGAKIEFGGGVEFVRALEHTWWVARKMLVGG